MSCAADADSIDPTLPDARAPLSVLLIEDDPDDARRVTDALHALPRFACRVRHVAAYAEARTALGAGDYDIVLLDHWLGTRPGLDLLGAAFDEERTVPVVLLTGATDRTLDELAERSGVADLFEKHDLRPKALERCIGYALERARTERALRSTRAFFRAAFDALHEHVAILDADGRILEVNRAWEEFALANGYIGANAACGTNYLEICEAATGAGADDAGRTAAGIRRVITGEAPSFEMSYPCHGPREERWYEMRVRRFDDGGAVRVLVAHQNVTERHRASEELRLRDERYRLLGRATNDVIWDWDLTTDIIVWNEAGPVVLSPELREPVPVSWWEERIHPDDRTRVVEGLHTLLDHGGTAWSDEYRFQGADGAYITVYDRGYVIRGADHRPLRMIGSMADVSERHRVQEQLREREQRYRLLFDHNPLPMWVLQHGSAAFLAVNAAAVAHYGYSREEFLAMTAFDIRPPEEQSVLRHLMDHPSPERTTFGVTRHRKQDGTVIEVDVVAHPLEYDGQPAYLVVANDVTQRNAAERMRDAALGMLRAVVSTSPVAIITVDRHDHVTMWNQAAEQLFGWTAAEVLGRVPPTVPPEHEEEWRRQTQQCVAGHPVLDNETQRLRKDGGRVDVVVSMTALVDAEGQTIGMVKLLSDITARRAAERERERLVRSLEFERNRLAAMFEQAPAFIAVLRGPEHVFEIANEAYYRLVGRRDLIGRPALEALPELKEQGLKELVDRVLQTGEPFLATRRAIHIQRSPDGPLEEVYLTFVYQALEEADGTRSGVMALGIDVTEQVHAEQDILESDERFRAVFERSPDGIAIHDGEVVVLANMAARRLLGGSEETDLAGLSVRQIVDERLHAAMESRLEQLGAGTAVAPMQQRWIGLDGVAREMEVASTPMMLGGRHMIQTVFRDVSERRRLEDQLRQSQKMEAVGRLAGGVAHDFNNLLTVIRANTEFLLEDLDRADPRREEALEIRQAADRAAGLTRQLLAFSRKQILEPRELDLHAVVTGLRSMLARMIGEDVTIETAAPGGDVGRVMADPGQIEQVLMNLVVNARDAMPEGGRILIETAPVTLGAEYAVGERVAVVPGNYVMLAVSDTGTGMSPEVCANVFEPFFTTKPTGQGTGLGLSTVYGIVKQSGGYVWVYSEPGIGTTFKLYFPRVVEPLPTATTPVPAAAVASAGTETVLLVEDEAALREAARRMLARRGYTVLQAPNGSEAIRIATEHPGPIHLVLTDVVMPETSGHALAERLRELRPAARVLFMSGYTDGDIVRRGVLDPGVSFLQKPFDAARLYEMVRRVLDGK